MNWNFEMFLYHPTTINLLYILHNVLGGFRFIPRQLKSLQRNVVFIFLSEVEVVVVLVVARVSCARKLCVMQNRVLEGAKISE